MARRAEPDRARHDEDMQDRGQDTRDNYRLNDEERVHEQSAAISIGTAPAMRPVAHLTA
jgi:hypothetical protein